MRDIEIRRITTPDPATATPDDTIEHAQALFDGEDLHHLPIVDRGRLVGLLSSSDLLKCFLLEGGATAAGAIPLRSIMVAEPVSIDAGVSLRDAAITLSAGGFHALPVTETGDSLVGIVTSTDLVDHLLRQLPSNDGSLSKSSGFPAARHLDDDQARKAVSMAAETLERGEDNLLARAVLDLVRRNHHMRDVCLAAERYMRSGLAEREHSVLIRKLAELSSLRETVYL